MSKEDKKGEEVPFFNIAPCYCQHCRELRAVAGKPAQMKVELKVPPTLYAHNVTTAEGEQQLRVVVSESESMEAIEAIEGLVHELRRQMGLSAPTKKELPKACEYPATT